MDRSNLQSIVQQLLSYLVKETSAVPDAAQSLIQTASTNISTSLSPNRSPAYRLVLSQRIVQMGSQETYENITNFEWYLSVLVDLAHVSDVNIGAEIRDQLVDIAGRVRAARPYAVKLMSSLLVDDNLIRNANDAGSCSEVLWAAAWICGEHCEQALLLCCCVLPTDVPSRVLSDPQKLLPHLLRNDVDRLSPDIIAMYIQAVLKVFGCWAIELAQRWGDDDLADLKEKVASIINRMRDLAGSRHIDVQERVSTLCVCSSVHCSYLPCRLPTPFNSLSSYRRI